MGNGTRKLIQWLAIGLPVVGLSLMALAVVVGSDCGPEPGSGRVFLAGALVAAASVVLNALAIIPIDTKLGRVTHGLLAVGTVLTALIISGLALGIGIHCMD